jgi:hypothetical protein
VSLLYPIGARGRSGLNLFRGADVAILLQVTVSHWFPGRPSFSGGCGTRIKGLKTKRTFMFRFECQNWARERVWRKSRLLCPDSWRIW